MQWRPIDGYKWPCRINIDGTVQKFYRGEWVTLTAYLTTSRARVKLRTAEDKRVDVPVVWLMADAFMGGRRPGMSIVHMDGCKLNNALWNLKMETKSECGKRTAGNRRRAVMKVAPDGTVVEIFKSGREAAQKEYISQSAISQRCLHRVKDPYRLNGYTYEYEDRKYTRRNERTRP